MSWTPEEIEEDRKYLASLTPEKYAKVMKEREAAHAKELAVYDENKAGLAQVKAYAEMEEVKKRFINLLGDRDGQAYVESVVIAVSGDEQLQQCTPKSIMISAMRAASLKLSVDKSMKQAHLVKFGKEATLIVDYHGLLQLSVNTGYYKIAPNVFEVYEGEEIKMERFSGKVEIVGEKTGDTVIGWCGYFKANNGTERWLYMTNEECDAHGKKYNPGGFSSSKSAWNTDRAKMRRKTVLRQLISMWGNFSPQVKNVIFQDEPSIDAEFEEMPNDENLTVPIKEKRTPQELIKEMTGA